MGAHVFYTVAVGDTAEKAFHKACEDAAWESGHGGYTGTIAEKGSFVMIPCNPNEEPYQVAKGLIHLDDRRISDKWGPAGCIDLGVRDGSHNWLFFGWASA